MRQEVPKENGAAAITEEETPNGADNTEAVAPASTLPTSPPSGKSAAEAVEVASGDDEGDDDYDDDDDEVTLAFHSLGGRYSSRRSRKLSRRLDRSRPIFL